MVRVSTPFDRDACAREAMGALVGLHDAELFEKTRSEAVMGIACLAYELADAMEAARLVRDVLKAKEEAT